MLNVCNHVLIHWTVTVGMHVTTVHHLTSRSPGYRSWRDHSFQRLKEFSPPRNSLAQRSGIVHARWPVRTRGGIGDRNWRVCGPPKFIPSNAAIMPFDFSTCGILLSYMKSEKLNTADHNYVSYYLIYTCFGYCEQPSSGNVKNTHKSLIYNPPQWYFCLVSAYTAPIFCQAEIWAIW